MNKGGTHCVQCGKRCLSLLDGLGPDELILLEQKRTRVHYTRGEVIYKEGILPFGLLALSDGKVKISKNSQQGKELIVELKKPVDFIGITELINGKRYETSAVALEDSSVCIIDRDDFFKVLNENLDFAGRIIRYFADELGRMQNKMLSLTQKHLDARLAETLLEVRSLYGVNVSDGKTINTPLRRNDIAALSGMTPSSVSRTLTQFENEGIISVQGRRIKILDKKRLEEISASDPQSHTGGLEQR
jgi:CRP/FNR family transcriptional regulator, polysaccharide utilization system transcription regulator